MSPKHPCILERSFFNKFPKSYYLIILLVLGSLLFELMPIGDSFDYESLSLEYSPVIWSTQFLFLQFISSAFLPGVFALILFFEYLRSHISEKNPADCNFEFIRQSIFSHTIITDGTTVPSFSCFNCSSRCLGNSERLFSRFDSTTQTGSREEFKTCVEL